MSENTNPGPAFHSRHPYVIFQYLKLNWRWGILLRVHERHLAQQELVVENADELRAAPGRKLLDEVRRALACPG